MQVCACVCMFVRVWVCASVCQCACDETLLCLTVKHFSVTCLGGELIPLVSGGDRDVSVCLITGEELPNCCDDVETMARRGEKRGGKRSGRHSNLRGENKCLLSKSSLRKMVASFLSKM